LRIPSLKVWAHVLVGSLLNVVAFSLFSAFAQLAATTSRVAILAYTMPIWAVLLAWWFLGERPNRVQALALLLCAIGLAILIYPLAANGIPLGILFALAVGVCWAGGTVYLKWAGILAARIWTVIWRRPGPALRATGSPMRCGSPWCGGCPQSPHRSAY
jgi:drug/metabolite transporter (DMT)-like permease